jgi:nitronate monooxygenase
MLNLFAWGQAIEAAPMASNALLNKLGIDNPVILAPMAGGPGTPELVAAVSNAGGLGSLGAAYMSPDQIKEAVLRIRALTSKPFAVNLFAGGYQPAGAVDAAPMLELLAQVHETLELPPPVLPQLPPDPFPSQLEAVLEVRPAAFTFTFGIPSPDSMARVRAKDITIMGTATTVQEARMLEEAGVDAVVVQGAEAGAHRGTFAGPFEASMVPTLDLLRQAVGAISLPVIASGGLMDGRDIAQAMALGASAAQLGTAFLPCPECGASAAYKQAVLSATGDNTVLTRAYSGRPARGLRNEFISRLEGRENVILPYPLQNALTRPMRTAAGLQGKAGFLSLWAGTGVSRARVLPAGDLVGILVEEMSSVRH